MGEIFDEEIKRRKKRQIRQEKEEQLGEAFEDKSTTGEAAKEVLNAEEAAELLEVNPYTVRQKARLGELPGRKVGKEWRFSRTALLEWLGGGWND